jgi:hypothetical protein
MTTFTIINFIGWTSFLIAYLIKWYMSRKEIQIQEQLNERFLKSKDLSTEEMVQLVYEMEDHQIKRFGAFGSYGVFSQILTFGMGLFLANLIFQFVN